MFFRPKEEICLRSWDMSWKETFFPAQQLSGLNRSNRNRYLCTKRRPAPLETPGQIQSEKKVVIGALVREKIWRAQVDIENIAWKFTIIHQFFKHPKWFGFCWPLVSENPCLPNPSNYESCRGTERIHQSRIGGPAKNGHGLAQNANDCLSQPGCKWHEGFNTMLLDTHCSRKTSF